MPKKSNKTAHVLSLLTNGGGEFQEENVPVSRAGTSEKSLSETVKKEVVVELQGSIQPDFLSDLVKSDLQKELDKQLCKKATTDSEDETDSTASERPPYSPTFMAKFGIKPAQEEEIPEEPTTEEVPSENEPVSPVSSDPVKSEIYVLEDFNDDEEDLPAESSMEPLPEKTSFAERDIPGKNTSSLHNLAEDFMIVRAPEIMQSFNMCTCQECIYHVVAVALNNTKPLYTVTNHNQLSQKLSSYESQNGTRLISEIKKACIKIKINPEHPKHPGPNHKKFF